jgi:lipopolysaccharide/colanic/teichoic acid biosynthesis glycosyltransferase
LLLPFIIIISIAVKLDSPGPLLFRQKRTGWHGKPFLINKFRSMVVDADKHGSVTELGDPRVTRVGRIIRLTSLDEIPQLINVFKGEMSLVGPRALLPVSIHPEEMRRQEMRPGVTSLPIVSGRQQLDWDRRMELDLWYVDHWSLWLDIKILLRTLWVVVSRKNVYDSEGKMKARDTATTVSAEEHEKGLSE